MRSIFEWTETSAVLLVIIFGLLWMGSFAGDEYTLLFFVSGISALVLGLISNGLKWIYDKAFDKGWDSARNEEGGE